MRNNLLKTAILTSMLSLNSCALPALVVVPFLEKNNKKDIHGYTLDINMHTNIQAYDLNNDGTIDEALIVTQKDNNNIMEHLVAIDADKTKKAWLDMPYTREMTQYERHKLNEFYTSPDARKISE